VSESPPASERLTFGVTGLSCWRARHVQSVLGFVPVMRPEDQFSERDVTRNADQQPIERNNQTMSGQVIVAPSNRGQKAEEHEGEVAKYETDKRDIIHRSRK
jgi:hypothetical protein